MQIACPNCNSRYRVPDESIGPGGRRVKCVKCDNIWLAEPEASSEETLPEEQIVSGESAVESEEAGPDTDENVSGDSSEVPRTDPEDGKELQESAGSEEKITQQSKAEADHAKASDHQQEEAAARRRKMREERKRDQSDEQLKSKSGSSFGWVALILFIVGLSGSAYFWKQEISQTWPPATILYDLIGMDVETEGDDRSSEQKPAIDYASITKVTQTAETTSEADGTRNLIVRGDIENISEQTIPAPDLIGILRDSENREIFRWSFGLQIESIPASSSVSFETITENISQNTVTVEVVLEWQTTQQ